MCYKTITNSIRLMAQDMPDCLLKYTFQGVMDIGRLKPLGKLLFTTFAAFENLWIKNVYVHY